MKIALISIVSLIVLCLILVLFTITTRPAFEYALLEECENITKDHLKSPSSYKLISANVFDATNKLDEADIEKYIESRGAFIKKSIANNEISAKIKNVSLNFDSKNPMGVNIRNVSLCRYGYTKFSSEKLDNYGTQLITLDIGSSSAKNPFIFKDESNEYMYLFPVSGPKYGFLTQIKSLKYIFADIKIN